MTPSTTPRVRRAQIPAECRECEITIRPGQAYWHVPNIGSLCIRCGPYHPEVRAVKKDEIPSPRLTS